MSKRMSSATQMHLSKSPCNQCLLSKNRLISEEAAEDLIQINLAQDSAFHCHKSQLPDYDDTPILCRGFYNKYWRETLLLRLGTLMGIIVEVVSAEDRTLTNRSLLNVMLGASHETNDPETNLDQPSENR